MLQQVLWSYRIFWSVSPENYREGNVSVWQWGVQLLDNPRSFCLMNPFQTWMPNSERIPV